MNRFDPGDLAHPGYYFSHAALSMALKKKDDADTFLRKAKTLYGIPMINRYQPDYFFIIHVVDPDSPSQGYDDPKRVDKKDEKKEPVVKPTS